MAPQTTRPRILITGASGAYGQLLTKRLILTGLDPSTLLLVTRDPSKLAEKTPSGVTLRKGSFDDSLSDLATAFSGADVVFLISTSRAGARLPQHQNAIDAAVKAGAQHVFYTGFIGADLSNPAALVVQEHRGTEEMLRKSGLAFTVLRDSMYADAWADMIIPSARASGFSKTNSGTGQIAPVSKDDCVEVAATLLLSSENHRNKIYNVTGPELVSWGDILALASRHFGQEIRCEVVSDEQMFADFDAMGIPRHPSDEFERDGVKGYHWNSTDMVSFGVAIRLGEMAVVSDDVEKIIGRKPASILDVVKSRT